VSACGAFAGDSAGVVGLPSGTAFKEGLKHGLPEKWPQHHPQSCADDTVSTRRDFVSEQFASGSMEIL
jgi:hypothetical protein